MVRQNLCGQRFGYLTVTELSEQLICGKKSWLCHCDCGNHRFSSSWNLLNGKNTSCGCVSKIQDLTGQKFGKLTVLSFDHKKGAGSGTTKYYWKCQCECGKNKIVDRSHLISNKWKVRSCGCLQFRVGKNSPAFRGYEGIYQKYFDSLQRGAKSRNFNFSITIEYAWNLLIKQNFLCALSHITLTLPKHSREKGSASLDRIDSTKGYIEGNVQWVHKDVNRMKGNLDENKFVDICRKIVNAKSV